MLMAALMRANKKAQSEFFHRRVEDKVFAIRGKEYRWMLKYYKAHGSFPSLRLFNQQFPQLNLKKVTEPLSELLKQVNDAYAIHQLEGVTDELNRLAQAGASGDEMISAAKHHIASLQTVSSADAAIVYGHSMAGLTAYRERYRQLYVEERTMDTPWAMLNNAIGFIDPGLILIHSRTSVGKTWISLRLAHHLMDRFKVLFVSKEMSDAVLEMRMDSIRYQLPYMALRRACLSPKDYRRYLTGKRMELNDSLVLCGNDSKWKMTQLRRMLDRLSPDILFIDSAYFLIDTRLEERIALGRLSQELKELSGEYRIPVVAVLQENRESEDKKGRVKSALKNIAGADDWAQDADLSIALSMSSRAGALHRHVSLAKGRDVPSVEFWLKWDLAPPLFPETQPPSQQGAGQTILPATL